MFLHEDILTLHSEDFEVSSHGRAKVVAVIQAHCRLADLKISVVVLPHQYFPHFTATNLYQDIRSVLFSEVEFRDADYGD